MKIMRTLIGSLIYFCAASFLALAIGVSVLLAKGSLDRGKMVDLLAAVYGLDLAEMRSKLESAQEDDSQVQIAYERVLSARTRASLDIDLRESAIDKTMGELHNLQNNVVIQRQRHSQVVRSFEKRLKEFQNIKNDARLQKVQQMLENMRPKQAKDQLMKMVAEDAKRDVVLILSSLPDDKQKKIVAEFKSEEEQTTLGVLLNEIRAGKIESELLKGTLDELGNVEANQP